MSRWRLVDRNEKTDLFDHLCSLRGWKKDELGFDYSTDLHDPYLLSGIKEAVGLIVEAQKKLWPIAIFGDYDADGTTAAAILSLTLEKLGLEHSVHLPIRDEGYGLTSLAVGKLPKGIKLLITVDNGIKSFDEIKCLKDHGVKTIILDHHLPDDLLPEADAIVDPHLPRNHYPFIHLCGGTLAYKFAVALSREYPELTETFLKWLLDLVAIATVSDVMPLIGENRALVHFGLMVLRRNRRPGIRHLLEHARISPENLSGYSLGYVIGPRFNASGRLGSNRPALDLLLCEDDACAQKLAEEIERANQTRLGLVVETVARAREKLFEQNKPADHLYAVYEEGWPVGVIGLVAGRLATEFHRPVVVGSLVDGKITASARSSAGFHLIEALDSSKQHLLRYGGHKQAAGLTLAETSWLKLTDQLKKIAKETIPDEALQGSLLIEAKLPIEETSLKLARNLETLEPYGYGNPQPIFLFEDWRVDTVRKIGQTESHIKLSLSSKGERLEAVGFNMAQRFSLKAGDQASFVGQLEANEWRGQERLQLKLLDYGPVEKEIEIIKHNENQGNIFLQ